MKKLKKVIALSAVMALLANTGHSEEPYCCDEAPTAYSDCCGVSYTSILIPVAALAVAGIIIASTDHHHHHHSSSSCTSFSSHSH